MSGECVSAQSCIELLRQIRDVSFAAVDESGAPQARIIDIMLAEPGAAIFCTARGKEFYRQLVEDGRVVVTGLTEGFEMIRLQGRAHRLPEDQLGLCEHSGAAAGADATEEARTD